MSRAEDRLYVCGWQGVKKLPQKCWYDLIVRGLASVTDVKKFSFQENGDIGWSGEGLRYVGKQLVPANHDGRGLDESKHHVELLPWMLEYPEVETSSSNPLVPSRATEDQSVVGSPLDIDGKTRFQRGKLIHRLLEILPTLPKQRQRVSCRRFLKRSIHGLDGKQCAQIESEVFSILTDPQLKFLFVGETSAEVPIVGTLHGSEGLQSVAGQVDRLVISKHEILIVDYKSNQSPPKSLSDVPELYLRQMATYRAVLSKIWQDRPVRCALLWTDGPYLMYLDDG
jgi:ATP-dependent helicase/nuclease subunit A